MGGGTGPEALCWGQTVQGVLTWGTQGKGRRRPHAGPFLASTLGPPRDLLAPPHTPHPTGLGWGPTRGQSAFLEMCRIDPKIGHLGHREVEKGHPPAWGRGGGVLQGSWCADTLESVQAAGAPGWSQVCSASGLSGVCCMDE